MSVIRLSDPGQRGLGSYHEADEPKASLSSIDRTSSSNIRQDRLDPIDDNGGQPSGSDDEALDHDDGTYTSESDDDGQESVADGSAKSCTSGEEPSADTLMIRTPEPREQSIRCTS